MNEGVLETGIDRHHVHNISTDSLLERFHRCFQWVRNFHPPFLRYHWFCKAEMNAKKTGSISEALSLSFMIVINEWTGDAAAASSCRCTRLVSYR